MGPPSRPETYQDVKATLQWFAAALAVPFALVVFYVVVPPEQRDALAELLEGLPGSQFFASAIGLSLIGLFAWVLVFLFEAHDRIYDRFVIGWRDSFATDFLLPMLYGPFRDKLDPRFFEEARKRPYEFTRPFYVFVGDSAAEGYRINDNLVVRFYETIIKYWVTQIVEIYMVSLILVVFAYFLVYERVGLRLTPLMWVLFATIVAFVINRFSAKKLRKTVRRKTAEEIGDIHRNHLTQLDSVTRELHEDQNLSYGP